MHHLKTHEQFQRLLETNQRFIVWFSAAWCGPCQNMNKQELDEASQEAGVPLIYCDQTVNDETREACAIRSFPTFVCFDQGAAVAKRQSADTAKVCMFIKQQKQVV